MFFESVGPEWLQSTCCLMAELMVKLWPTFGTFGELKFCSQIFSTEPTARAFSRVPPLVRKFLRRLLNIRQNCRSYFQVAVFPQQFLSFAKSDEENLRSTSFAKKNCRRWKVANHYCVSQIPTNKMYAVGFTVTKSFVAHYRAKFSIAICCERFGKFIE